MQNDTLEQNDTLGRVLREYQAELDGKQAHRIRQGQRAKHLVGPLRHQIAAWTEWAAPRVEQFGIIRFAAATEKAGENDGTGSEVSVVAFRRMTPKDERLRLPDKQLPKLLITLQEDGCLHVRTSKATPWPFSEQVIALDHQVQPEEIRVQPEKLDKIMTDYIASILRAE